MTVYIDNDDDDDDDDDDDVLWIMYCAVVVFVRMRWVLCGGVALGCERIAGQSQVIANRTVRFARATIHSIPFQYHT